jgi:hypothetical protein
VNFRKNGRCEAHRRELREIDITPLIKQHVVHLKNIFVTNLEQAKVAATRDAQTKHVSQVQKLVRREQLFLVVY